MKNLNLAIGTLAFALAAGSASAQVIMSDDFNYANLAAMQANWGAAAGMSLDLGNGNPAPAGAHDGSATVHVWEGGAFSVTPTDANPLVLAADLYYSGTGGQRNSIGLRNGAAPLFEVGFYNQTGANGLSTRVLNFAGNENWAEIVPYSTLGATAQWIRLEATFTASDLTIAYDLGADGSVDGTYVSTGAASANPFIDLRFGGPSGVSSSGGGFAVDNISLTVVPEPSTYALGALGMVMAGWAYRRRKA